MKQLSADELKDSIGDVLKIERTLRETFGDGFQFTDAFRLLDLSDEAVEVYRDAPQAWKELKDLDPVELKEVIEHFAVEFDITNDEVELRIENGLRLLEEGYVVILSVKGYVGRVKDYVTSWKPQPIAA